MFPTKSQKHKGKIILSKYFQRHQKSERTHQNFRACKFHADISGKLFLSALQNVTRIGGLRKNKLQPLPFRISGHRRQLPAFLSVRDLVSVQLKQRMHRDRGERLNA